MELYKLELAPMCEKFYRLVVKARKKYRSKNIKGDISFGDKPESMGATREGTESDIVDSSFVKA